MVATEPPTADNLPTLEETSSPDGMMRILVVEDDVLLLTARDSTDDVVRILQSGCAGDD